jgi:amino acid transporter
MNNNKIKIFAVSLFFIMFFSAVNFCYASDSLNLGNAFKDDKNSPLNAAAGVGAGFNTDVDFQEIVAAIITSVLSLMGVIFLALMIYAGFKWMTARGEEEKVTDAKETLTRAIIGLIIVLAAYAISYFVVSSLSSKVLNDSGSTTEQAPE